MYYRTYLSKDTTILSDSYVNLGANPVNRLFFSGTMGRERYSRILMGFDINPLIEKYNNCEIGDLSKVKHYLTFYPTRFYDEHDSENCQATSFELCVFKIKQDWDEGCGYDYECNDCDSSTFPYHYFETRCQASNGAANWFNAKENTPWQENGVINTDLYLSPVEYDEALEIAIENIPTGTIIDSGTTVSDIMDFDYYTGSPYMQCIDYSCNDSVIKIDVTDDINEHIISGTPHYGYGIAFAREYEDNPRGITKTLGFFSMESDFYFKPYIETDYDFSLRDNRANFYENVDNNLYLHVNINGNPSNLDKSPIVEIYDAEGELYTTQTGQCITKGVYGIKFSATGSVTCGLWEDHWKNLFFNGRSLKNTIMEFELKSNTNYYQLGHELNNPKDFQFKLYGIKHLEYIRLGEKRKVVINAVEKYKSKKRIAVDNIQYRIYIKEGVQQYDIIEWRDVNMGVCDNYIYIDTSWMLPQDYYLDFKVHTNGEITVYPNEIKFSILEDLETKK